MGLVTRFFGPNRKGSLLTIKEMDDNLYYLQSVGVSGFTYFDNQFTLINPTGGTISVVVNEMSGLTINGTLTVNGISVTGDTYITSGSFDNDTDTLTLFSNNINPILITGFTDYYTTGGTYDNNTKLISFLRNDETSGYTVDLSSIDVNDTYSTGGTVTQFPSNNNNEIIVNISGNEGFVPFNITGITDTFTTGGTYDNNTKLITFLRNGETNYSVDLSTINESLLKNKVGVVDGSSFSGNPKKADVIFSTPFPNTNYAIFLTGAANRVFTHSNKTVSGFTISANANLVFTGDVYWQAINFGETT
jgi:hypothetical protein